MKRPRPFAFAALAALLLAACASPSGEGSPRTPRERAERLARVGEIPTVDVSARVYTQALEMKAAGNCDGAVPLFYRLAIRGEGFEPAQFHLAECLLARAEPTVHDTVFLDGLVWMRRAAEAGSVDAQGALALIYLAGPEGVRDAAEAAFWYELHLANPRAKLPGFTPMSYEQRRQLESELDEELRIAARERVRNWRRHVWSAPEGALDQVGESVRRPGG